MITLAIAGTILGFAIPSFRSTITHNRLSTYANELVTTLNLARSEAIKRGIQVSVARTSSSVSTWEAGWRVFVDINGDGSLDTADSLLQTHEALAAGYTLRTGTNFGCWVAFTAKGLSRGSGASCGGGLSNDTFRLCDSSADTTVSRSITVNPTGRAKTAKTTDDCP